MSSQAVIIPEIFELSTDTEFLIYGCRDVYAYANGVFVRVPITIAPKSQKICGGHVFLSARGASGGAFIR